VSQFPKVFLEGNVWLSPRFASALQSQGKKALLVGVNKYHDSKLNGLRFAVNDVSSVYSVLTDPYRGGFASDNCILMTDKSEGNLKPLRSNLLSSINSLSGTAKPNDYILFFFSGHGIEENGKSYLLPCDARINVLRDTAVSIDWIKTTLQSSKAHTKVLILDACHAGAMKGKAESGRMTKGLHDALFPPMEGFAVLSSCKLHEASYEMPEKKHGVFSYFLIEGLQGGADFDSDGHIMVSDASRYTTEKTMDWSFKENVVQTPNLESHVVGDLVLVDVPSPEHREIHRKIKTEPKSDLDSPIDTIRVHFQKDEYLPKSLCTSLVNHCNFELHEIKPHKAGYIFPLGRFDASSLNVNYSPKNRSLIDAIIGQVLSLGTRIQSIAYDFNRLLDLYKVGKVYKALGLKAEEYDPKAAMFLRAMWHLPNYKEPIYLVFYNNKENGQSAILADFTEWDEKLFKEKWFKEFAQPSRFLSAFGNVWAEKKWKKVAPNK
jgi:hypothetical protein